MTIDTGVLAKQIYEQARQLSPENLADLAKYVEFLRFTPQDVTKESSTPNKLRIVKLRGLFKGDDFSPELLAEARREMWQSWKRRHPNTELGVALSKEERQACETPQVGLLKMTRAKNCHSKPTVS